MNTETATTEDRAVRLENIEFLIDAGEHRDHIANRLGFGSTKNLRDFLSIHNRLDLWYAAPPVWHPVPKQRARQAADLEKGRARHPRQKGGK
jgi:hypothetical protein